MPIYEYRCGDCGHELEALQKLSDPKLTTCPECGRETLTKLVSASAFVLKGSGWYQTDFRDKDKPKANQTSDKSGGESADSGSKQAAEKSGDKAESKSESKTGDSKGKSESNKSDSKPDKKAAGE